MEEERTLSFPKRRLAAIGAAMAIAGTAAAVSVPASGAAGSGLTKVGVALTYNNTAFWAAYISYESQYAKQMHIQLLGPKLAGTNASLQNTQVEDLVNQGAKAVIVNPETATSMVPAINYAAKHHVQLISVDTIVGKGHVYMVVRASNLIYGEDACAYFASQNYPSGSYVVDLEGDLTSSNGADRTNGFNACMKANAPSINVLADPTVWVAATATTDTQTALNAYGSKLVGIYDQYSGPDPAAVQAVAAKSLTGKVAIIGDDGVAYEMCYVNSGLMAGAQDQPADLYAKGALTYALDAAKGVKLKPGQSAVGAPKLANVSYLGDTNLGDPIVGPLVTKTATHFNMKSIPGAPGNFTSRAVTDPTLWGNVYGKAHGGDCSGVQAPSGVTLTAP
jgi:simple sugar transport system substrate-binding protein/ribose transport system substrate-binding protein